MRYTFLCVLCLFFFSLNCERIQDIQEVVKKDGFGKISIKIANSPPVIKSVTASLSRSGYADRSIQLIFSDSDRTASGSFTTVPNGTWHLKVDAIDSASIIWYSGEKDVFVIPDTTTKVDVILSPTPGDVEIIVTWGNICVPIPEDIVAWWTADDSTRDIIGDSIGYLQGGVSYTNGIVQRGFYFNGVDGRIHYPDMEALKLTGSLTIDAWVYVSSYPIGHEGHILFRGDDRIGIDPYNFRILPSGNIEMLIASATSQASLRAPMPLQQFVYVATTLDSLSGLLKIYIDGNTVAETTTTVRPFKNLDSDYSPGIGIGNTQGYGLAHNSPFHGIIDELTVYRRALTATEIKSIYLAGVSGKCR
jgi:hypothetical protein